MANKQKILLVEDDRFLIRAYKDGLERRGFEVDTARDGNEAVEKVKSNKPDLILLDLVMPDKNGFEVLEDIKMDDDLKNIPVIILTNLGQEVDKKKGLDLGAVDYLIKSDYSMGQVVDRVREYLTKEKVKRK